MNRLTENPYIEGLFYARKKRPSKDELAKYALYRGFNDGSKAQALTTLEAVREEVDLLRRDEDAADARIILRNRLNTAIAELKGE